MLTKEQVESVLARFPAGAEHVDVVGGLRFVATVLSVSFEGQNEPPRQEAVWSFLRKNFTEDELNQVEFVFTDTPAERAAS